MDPALNSDTFPLPAAIPLPWRVVLRTRSAKAIYMLAGTLLAHVLSRRFHVVISSAALTDALAIGLGACTTFLALLGRRQAPVRDIPRLQKLVDDVKAGK